MDVPKFSINPNDLISVNLNLDNFKKYITYMDDLSKSHNDQIKSLIIKTSKFDEILYLIENVTEKFDSYDKRIEDLYHTQSWHATKFLEIEQNNSLIKEKINTIDTLKKTITEQEVTINNLKQNFEETNLKVEENYKEIGECKDILDKLPAEFNNNINNLTNHFESLNNSTKNYFKEEIQIFHNENVSIKFDEFSETINELIAKVNELAEINNKYEDELNDEEMDNIDDNNYKKDSNDKNNTDIKEIKNTLDQVKIIRSKRLNRIKSISNSNVEISNTNIIKQTVVHENGEEIDNLKKELQIMRNHNTKSLEDLKEEIKLYLDIKISQLKNNTEFNFDNNNNNSENLSNLNNSISDEVKIRDENLRINENISDNKVNDNIIINKEENNNFYKRLVINSNHPNSDIQKNQMKDQILNSILNNQKILENRLKQFETNLNEKTNKENVTEIVNEKIKTELKNKSLNKILNENKNEINQINQINQDNINQISIQELIDQNEINRNELDKLNQNLEELQKNYKDIKIQYEELQTDHNNLTNNFNSQINPISNKLQLTIQSTQKDSKNLSQYMNKFSDLEKVVLILKSMLDDTSKNGDNNNDEDYSSNYENFYSSLPVGNLRDMIRNNTTSLKGVSDRVEKMQLKMDHVLSEIVSKLKKDLFRKNYIILFYIDESQKVLEEFKVDLKFAIVRLDNQLKEKVDKINFDEYGKRIDNKISNEFSKKIDKNELKKNNNMLSKKIDNLETKISRTLVDTLIDIQLDEAPLIYKRGSFKDKCASCNQFIHEPSSPMQNCTLRHVEPNNERSLIKNMQEITNKFGIGSYSRMLNNCPVVDEKIKKNTLMNSFSQNNLNNLNLPDIGGVNSNINSQRNNNLSNLNQPEYIMSPEKKLKNAVFSELDKKNVRGENIIKSVDRLYENLEKKV